MKYLLLLAILPLCSCASIVSSKNSPVTINSTPPGAQVEITDRSGQVKFVGQTPSTAILPNGDGYFTKARYSVKVSKEGYETSVSTVNASLNPWYFGNIVFGGLIGILIVDPLTGAMYEIDAPQIQVNLSATSPPVVQTPAPQTAVLPAEPSVESVDGKLLRLKRLKDEGVLTEKEFQTKKKELLGKLK